jgi:hypothetical protein
VLKAIELLGSVADASRGSRQLLDNAAIIPRLFRENPQAALQALQQFGCENKGTFQGFASTAIFVTAQFAAPSAAGVGGTGGGFSSGGLLTLAVGAGIILAVGGIILWDEWTQPAEFRLEGFDEKVGTLAEHLAKLLDREVAGYPRPDPNPNGDPDGGWCRTIRRIIKEIDDAGYSTKQFNRDLEAAGYSKDNWNVIVAAVRDVIRDGLCDDHWGDFNGGSLASG